MRTLDWTEFNTTVDSIDQIFTRLQKWYNDTKKTVAVNVKIRCFQVPDAIALDPECDLLGFQCYYWKSVGWWIFKRVKYSDSHLIYLPISDFGTSMEQRSTNLVTLVNKVNILAGPDLIQYSLITGEHYWSLFNK